MGQYINISLYHDTLKQWYSSVEQYTSYVVIPQYYFPVLSNFLILQYCEVQILYIKNAFSTKMRFIYISKTFELV